MTDRQLPLARTKAELAVFRKNNGLDIQCEGCKRFLDQEEPCHVVHDSAKLLCNACYRLECVDVTPPESAQ